LEVTSPALATRGTAVLFCSVALYTLFTVTHARTHKHPKLKKLKVKGGDIALNGTSILELRSVTCRMGSHSVTCHPTQVNAPRLSPSQIGGYSIYLPRRDGRL